MCTCLGVGPTANLTPWGIQENDSPVKSARFFYEFQEIVFLPLSTRVYLQVLATATAVSPVAICVTLPPARARVLGS